MHATLLLAMLIGQTSAPPREAPLPVIEQRERTFINSPSGEPLPRNTLTLRNVHASPLVGWRVAWSDFGRASQASSFSSSDRVLSPSLQVQSGGTATMVRIKPCEYEVQVVAAVYLDGSAGGDNSAIGALLSDRSDRASQLLTVLSVLKTTRLANSGVASRAEVEELLGRIEGPGLSLAKGTVLEILSQSPQSEHLFAKPGSGERVSKATLITAIEAGVKTILSANQKTGRQQ